MNQPTASVRPALSILGVALLGAAAAASVAAFTLSPQISARGKAGSPLVIRISYHDPSLAVATQMRAGVDAAARKFKVDARLVGPVGGGAEKQVAEIENLITSGVDGLGVSSTSTDALVPTIDRAIQKGIPVVTFNTDNPKAQRLTFVGQDLVKSGRAMADQLVKYMGPKGNILIFTVDAAAQWSKDREGGVRAVLARYPDIKILDFVNTTNDSQRTYAAIESAMTAHPNVNGIISLDCCSTPAAGQYLKTNGLIGKVKLVGSDALDQQNQLMKLGAIQALIDQDPYNQGYRSVEVLVNVIRTGKLPPKMTDTGVKIVDSTNIASYLKK